MTGNGELRRTTPTWGVRARRTGGRGIAVLAIFCGAVLIGPPAGADGAGVFAPHPTTPSIGADHSEAVSLGDLDGDGDLDAVVANAGDNCCPGEAETVWMNNGSGSYTAHLTTPTFGAGSHSRDVALGDLDKDGDLDAVVANVGNVLDSVWLNGGAGSFTPHPTFPTFDGGFTTTGVALADINGDTFLDAVFHNFGDPASVWLNNGSGGLVAHPTAPIFGGGAGTDVALGDLDADSDVDAILVNALGEAETVWMNNGSGVFTAHPTVPAFGAGESFDVGLGDIDGDGDLDAVVANAGAEPETVWLNDGTGGFTSHPNTGSFGGNDSRGVALGDLDGDGDLDATVANAQNQPETVWLNDGAGAFTAHPTMPAFPSCGAAGQSLDVELGDLDGDGDLDAFVANWENQPETVWLNIAASTLSINDATVTEGDAGTTNAAFTITRSGETSVGASVDVSTADGSAVAPGDYTALTTTTVTFAAGETTKTVVVSVNGDTSIEANDGFTVNLACPSGATMADGTGVGRITNDDSAAFSVDDATIGEGDSGTSLANFTVSRSGDTGDAATVQWRTMNVDATAGSDYVAVPLTTLSFAGGETTKTVSVTVNGDTTIEPNERFYVRLTSPTGGHTIADATGVGTITNDDTIPVNSLSIGDATVIEGDSGTVLATFTVSRTGDTSAAASVQWFTVPGTGTAGEDFVAVTSTALSFGPGETTKSVSVTVNGDTAVEGNETYVVRLASPAGATIADGSGLGRITNDDAASVSVGDTTVTEGDSGTTTATFNVVRSGDIGGTATVQWATADGTATAGSGDYVAVGTTVLTFGAGETIKQVTVTVNGDITKEANETFQVKLTGATGMGLVDGSGLGRITNDD